MKHIPDVFLRSRAMPLLASLMLVTPGCRQNPLVTRIIDQVKADSMSSIAIMKGYTDNVQSGTCVVAHAGDGPELLNLSCPQGNLMLSRYGSVKQSQSWPEEKDRIVRRAFGSANPFSFDLVTRARTGVEEMAALSLGNVICPERFSNAEPEPATDCINFSDGHRDKVNMDVSSLLRTYVAPLSTAFDDLFAAAQGRVNHK